MPVITAQDAASVVCPRAPQSSLDASFHATEYALVFGPDFERKIERSLNRVRRKLIFRFLLRREFLRVEIFLMQARSATFHTRSNFIRYLAKLALNGYKMLQRINNVTR
jgi:hypothetical protein